MVLSRDSSVLSERYCIPQAYISFFGNPSSDQRNTNAGPASPTPAPSTAASHTSERNGTPLDLPYVDERPESVRDGQSPMSPGDDEGDMSEGDDDSDLFQDENNGNPLPFELYPGSPGGKALLAAIYPYIRAAAKKEKPSSLCGSLWGYTAFYESDRFNQEMLHDTVCKTGLPFAEVVYPAWVVHHSLGDGPAELLRQLLALKLYAKRPGYTWEQYCDALEASRDDFEKARKSGAHVT